MKLLNPRNGPTVSAPYGRRGVGLIEVLLAAAVVGIGISAVLSMVIVFNSSIATQNRVKTSIFTAAVAVRKVQMGDADASATTSTLVQNNVSGVTGLSLRKLEYTCETGIPGTEPYVHTNNFLVFTPPGEPQN
jgi:Tfp pilus assembly protein PilV